MMFSFISIFSIFTVSFSVLFSSNIPFFASLFHFEGAIPTNLGIVDSTLAKCPSTPNCVSSQESDTTHYIKPLSYDVDRDQAYDSFVKILSVVPDTKIVEQKEDYIRTESRSKIMGFVDDAEFYFPNNEKVIHWRSSSRLGESDLGVNRRRLEQIRLAFQDFNK